MPHHANKEHQADLVNVTTLAVACRRWRKSKSTLTYAIDAGNIIGERVGRAVLISTRSLIARYGLPVRD